MNEEIIVANVDEWTIKYIARSVIHGLREDSNMNLEIILIKAQLRYFVNNNQTDFAFE